MFRSVAVLTLLALFFSVSAASAQDQTSPAPSNYSGWQHCRQGMFEKLCHNDNPFHSSESIIEYFNYATQEPRLLIWDVFERSRTDFRMHGEVRSYVVEKTTTRMYVWEGTAWKFLESREFSRAASLKNVPIPIFGLDSPFGKEYKKFLLEIGIVEENIKIPTWRFLE